ncbi:MAG TPA: hypothetical protein VF705_01070, partial [Longimicrobium sp.]
MTMDELLAAWEERYGRIAGRLDAGDASPQVKDEIVGMFKEAETAIERMTAFKETIRELVQRYKTLAGEKQAAPRGGAR